MMVYLQSLMNQRRIVDLTFFDFARMFDTICHSATMAKLHCFSVSGVLLKCIEHFLANRCMQVKVGRALSRRVAVFSWVLQGSVPVLIFFLAHVHCKVKALADDKRMYLLFDATDSESTVHILNNIKNLSQLKLLNCLLWFRFECKQLYSSEFCDKFMNSSTWRYPSIFCCWKEFDSRLVSSGLRYYSG